MKTYKVSKDQLHSFFAPYFEKNHRVVAPSLNSLGQVEYRAIKETNEIVWDAVIAAKPPKNFLFPPSSVVAQFDSANPLMLESDKENAIKTQMLFGLRPCDLSAIAYLDQFFLSNITDYDYHQRREQTLIVGMACVYPSRACFCTTMEVDPGDSQHADIFLTPAEDHFFVEAITEKGEHYLVEVSKQWTEAQHDQVLHQKKEISQKTSSQLIEHINLSSVKGHLGKVYDHAFWSDYSEPCVVCGACTFDCPTCSCFDVNDALASANSGCRYRSWDSCSFFDFALHASGHNPRSSKTHRLRQRILHKFHYTVEKMNQWSCTGCGRCIRSCPAGINTRSILKDAKEALGELDQ